MRATAIVRVCGLLLAHLAITGVLQAELFAPAPSPERKKARLAIPPGVLRSRSVRIRSEALPDETWYPGQAVAFNLFDDLQVEGVLERMTYWGPDDYTWIGRWAEPADGIFILTVKNDAVLMNLRSRAYGSFHLRSLGEGVHQIQEIDESMYLPCSTAPADDVDAGSAKAAAVPKLGDDGSVFDVMVLYTPAARNGAGGTNGMLAVIHMAVDEANQAYETSGIAARMRLVYAEETDYVETGDASTDLGNLRGTSDGFMDGIHATRDAHGADLVALVGDFTGTCGRAYTMTALSSGFESSAFAIVTLDCAIGNYSFVHELGHNMGCRHHEADTTSPGVFPYSYGWLFSGVSGGDYRTVMASLVGGGSRLQFFSNTNLTYDGVATGSPAGEPDEADNTLSINLAAATVAGWRTTTHQLELLPVGTFLFTGPQGGPFSPGCAPCTLTNLGAGMANWSASSQAGLVTPNPGSGSLPGEGATNLLLCVNNGVRGFPEGTYQDMLVVSNAGTGFVVSRPITIRVGTFAHLPFFDGFEDGVLRPYWSVSGTFQFRSNVTTANTPFAGSYHLTLDDTFGGNNSPTSRNEVTLAVDLADFTNVVLSFWARDYGDEPDGPPASPFQNGADFDGLAVSDDGTNWYAVLGLTNLTSTYAMRTVDLDSAVAPWPINYRTPFFFRFNQYDNFPIDSDGIAIDSVSLTGDSLALDPPVIQAVERAGGDAVVIRWGSEAEATYTVTRATSMLQEPEVLASNLAATVPVNSYTAGLSGEVRGFYGLRAQY